MAGPLASLHPIPPQSHVAGIQGSEPIPQGEPDPKDTQSPDILGTKRAALIEISDFSNISLERETSFA